MEFRLLLRRQDDRPPQGHVRLARVARLNARPSPRASAVVQESEPCDSIGEAGRRDTPMTGTARRGSSSRADTRLRCRPTARAGLVLAPPWHYSADFLIVEYRTDPEA